jgi:glutamate--cysteine ligase
VTYLFGASPALCKSFRPDGHELLTELDRATWHAPFATSLRMSDLGYRNKTQGRLAISANSLGEYVAGLSAAVTTVEPRYEAIGVVVDGEYRQLNANILQIENEYYSSIRPKPSKSSPHRPIVALRTLGVEYVEVRTLDLNLTDPVGLDEHQMRFIEALLIFCLLSDSPPIDSAEQQDIDRRDLAVAREGRRPGLKIAARGADRLLADFGPELLDAIGEVAALLDENANGYVTAIDRARSAFRDPTTTPSAGVLRDLEREQATFFEFALALAHNHHAYLLERPLGAEQEATLDGLATRSLAEAAALERNRSQSFDEFLSDYFASV